MSTVVGVRGSTAKGENGRENDGIIKKGNKFLFFHTFDRLNAVKTFYTSKDINLRSNSML